jgi:hypothetical protein
MGSCTWQTGILINKEVIGFSADIRCFTGAVC